MTNATLFAVVRIAGGIAALAALPLAGSAHSSQTLDLQAARKAAAEIPRLHSLLVSRQGTLVLEHYASARRSGLSNVKSVSKSIVSTLVGIAVDRKLIAGVKQPIVDYFPQLRSDPDKRKQQITVEHLLTMQSGLESTSFDNYGAWVRSRNWIRYALERPLVADPGTTMEYSTGNTHLLSAILTTVAKMTTRQFAQQALGRPLGITIAEWPRDPQGIYFGGNEMLLTPRQMLAIGEMYLNRGRVKGTQVVPESWVAVSCQGRGRSRFNPDQSYGYGWWTRDFTGTQACFAWGYGGQYILVFPELQVVVVTTSSTDAGEERRGHRRRIFELVETHLVGPLMDR